ncbi:MAG: hypothetical protein WCB62_10565, partial [Pseudolabrys sp.]
MIDAVAATARTAPLKTDQLRQQPRMVEQIKLAAVDQRHNVPVEVRLRLALTRWPVGRWWVLWLCWGEVPARATLTVLRHQQRQSRRMT